MAVEDRSHELELFGVEFGDAEQFLGGAFEFGGGVFARLDLEVGEEVFDFGGADDDGLAEVGVDITDADFWRGGFAVVEQMITELEAS